MCDISTTRLTLFLNRLDRLDRYFTGGHVYIVSSRPVRDVDASKESVSRGHFARLPISASGV
jgi:hypothetical protein